MPHDEASHEKVVAELTRYTVRGDGCLVAKPRLDRVLAPYGPLLSWYNRMMRPGYLPDEQLLPPESTEERREKRRKK